MIATVAPVLLSYVAGSVPTGLWLGLWLRKTDIRQHGSRNIGATNTLRVLGKRLGAVALLGDMAKGAISVLVFARLSDWQYAPLACALAAIAGHTFSIFLGFRGGKGVATSAGAFFGLAPIPMAIALAVFVIVVALTRMVSAGSILAALAMAISVFAVATEPAVRLIAIAVAALIVFRHRENIQRIVQRRENKIF